LSLLRKFAFDLFRSKLDSDFFDFGILLGLLVKILFFWFWGFFFGDSLLGIL
jgi:hypothetical protein